MARQPREGGSNQGAADGSNTAPLLQGSFTSGELAPALYARTDLAKFHSGAKFLQNWFVSAQGGVYNRAGTLYVGNANSTGAVRLIPFSFSTLQTYVLVFTQQSIQIVTQGGFVTQDGTSATPAVTVTTPYAGADLFAITYAQDADVLTLCHPNYPPAYFSRMSATNWTYAPISPGTKLTPPRLTEVGFVQQSNPSGAVVLDSAFIYAITSVKINPPDESALSNVGSCKNYDLSFNQYGIYNLVYWIPEASTAADYYNIYRYYQGGWAFEASTKGVLATGGMGSVSGTLALLWQDNNTTPDTNTAPPNATNPFFGASFIGSIAGTLLTITGFNSGTIETGDLLAGANVSAGTSLTGNVSGASFLGSINGTVLTVSQVYSGTITVGDGLVGPNVPAGEVIEASTSGTTLDGQGTYNLSIGANLQNQNMMDMPSGGAVYSVSISQTAASGLIIDNENYPAACGYFQQRAVFGGTNAAPAEFFTSQTGNYSNFNIRQPLLDSDAITATLANNQVNQIRHIVSMNDMVVFTNSGAWKVSGQSNSGDVITPSNVVAIPQAYSGAAEVQPIVVSPDILYVQEKGSAVRDLAYNVYTNLYTGSDISELAIHLFRGYQVIDWAWAQEPWKIVWAIRNDGTLLGLTYQKEEDVCAWHHHVTSSTLGPAGVATGPGSGGGGGGGGNNGAFSFTGSFKAGQSFSTVTLDLPSAAQNVTWTLTTSQTLGGDAYITFGTALSVSVISENPGGGFGPLPICNVTYGTYPGTNPPLVPGGGYADYFANVHSGAPSQGASNTGSIFVGVFPPGVVLDWNTGGSVTTQSISGEVIIGAVTAETPNGTAYWTDTQFPAWTSLNNIAGFMLSDSIGIDVDYTLTGVATYYVPGSGGGGGGGTPYTTSYPGKFLSVASVTEATVSGEEDVIYLAVGRVLQGEYVVTIERMQSRVLGVGDEDITQAWFVDCGLQYSNDGTLTNTVSGLDYLAGQTVSILADGKVQPQQIVPTSGTITLPISAATITVGLPISAQMETLPLDAGSPTIQGKYKRLTHARIFVSKTRGLQVGPNTPSGPDLIEVSARHDEPWGSPPKLFTGQQLVHPPGTWDPYGSMWVEQNYPLPACVLGIEPWVSVGE